MKRLENIEIGEIEKVLELSGQTFWIVAPDGTILDVSGALETGLGYTADELRGSPLRDIIVPEHLKEASRLFDSVAHGTEGSGEFEIELRVKGKTGRGHDVKVIGVATTRRESGEPVLFGLTTDITRQKVAERALEAERMLFYKTFEHAPNGIVLLHLDTERGGMIKAANEEVARMTGFTQDEMIGLWLTEGGLIDIDQEKLARALVDSRAILAGEKSSFSIERVVNRPDGTSFRVKADVSALDVGLLGDPDDPYPINALAHIEDVTDRRQAEGELQHQARHDSLTDLLNRRRFISLLTDRLDRGSKGHGGGALLMIDLDGFKAVNDSHGHLAGDGVLREVAVMLREELRESDPVARLGGDEFAVLLPKTDVKGAREVAGSLLERFERSSIEIDHGAGASFLPRVSIGAIMLDGRPVDAESALRICDQAMYEAKRQGGARYVIDLG
ncbi:MAG TPA: diguanylate cyclase [Solirubrobacterales bacterium]|nr:diguanylate cyclase [Solirubrobacterales bacterium]